MKNNLDKPLFYFDQSVFDYLLDQFSKQGYFLPSSVDRDCLCHAFINHAWSDLFSASSFIKKYLI